MDINNFFQGEQYKKLIKYLGILLIALIIFGAGVFVGHKSEEFSYHWAMNYPQNFGGSDSPFGMMSLGDDNPSVAHGSFGNVIGVNLPSFAVKGPNEIEKVIIIAPNTVIRKLQDSATSTDIHIGDAVVVIGGPNPNGQIVASFIRIVPK